MERVDLTKFHLPVKTVLVTLFAILFIGYLVGQLTVFITLQVNDVDLAALLDALITEPGGESRILLKIITLVNHVTLFLIPSLLVSWMIYRQLAGQFLKIDRLPNFNILLLVGLLIPVFAPIVHLSMTVNSWVPLPEWLSSIEEESADLIKAFLTMDSTGEFLFSFFLMAIIPALGEELLFRGVLQQTLQRHFQNPHTAIWFTAIIFSFFHFQFEGFLPRMILGALLGYLFFWTKNLWIPIFAHLIFNGSQVMIAWFAPEQIDLVQNQPIASPPFAAYVFSFIFVFLIIRYIKKLSAEANGSEHTP